MTRHWCLKRFKLNGLKKLTNMDEPSVSVNQDEDDLKIDDVFLEEVRKENSGPVRFERLLGMIKDFLTTPEEWRYSYLPLLIEPHPCLAKFDVEAIGSSSEGLSITEYSEAGINEELDITLVLKTIQASEKPLLNVEDGFAEIIPSAEFPGHVFVRVNNAATAERWSNLCNIVTNERGTVNEFFISPEAVTDEFYLMMCYRHSVENLKRFEKYVSPEEMSNMIQGNQKLRREDVELLQTFIADDKQPDLSEKLYTMYAQEGPAFKTTMLFEGLDISLQFDCAVAIRCVEWPKLAGTWAKRHRSSGWPSHDIISNVVADGCLVVPKCPTESKTKLEWRLSFCLAERKLIRSLTADQKLCYIFLKGMWRKFLKPPSGKALQSYHLKNVLLWEYEEVQIDKWSKNKITQRIFGLLSRLKSFIDKENCPHYIIPENNLFQDIDKDVLYRSGERVGTCITQAKVVWIENTALFILSPEKTRIGMKKEMLDLYLKLIEKLCKALADFATNKKQKFLEIKVLEEDAPIVSSLQETFGIETSNLIVEILNKAAVPNQCGLVRRYMCSRASPKQLFISGREGLLDFICSSVSALTAWTELTELVTQLEILKTEKFTPYGFSATYASTERVNLLVKFVGEWSLNNGDVFDAIQILPILFGNLSDLIDIDQILDFSHDSSSEEFEEVYSYNCDNCENEIKSERYHCTLCEDFDLCKSCYETGKKHAHDLVKVGKEETVLYSRI